MTGKFAMQSAVDWESASVTSEIRDSRDGVGCEKDVDRRNEAGSNGSTPPIIALMRRTMPVDVGRASCGVE